MPSKNKTKSGTGLKKETAAAISYVLGPVTGILFLVLENDSFVRFHAMQSTIFSVAAIVVNSVLTATVFLGFLVPLLALGEFVLWLVLIYKASTGEKWALPVLGPYVEKFLK